MVSLILSIVLLVAGYFVYSRVAERVFGADPEKKTPCQVKEDGVDYVRMPWYKVFLIQFLNIAGLGPIFGAIMGAMFGPASFLWIVFGAIFGGAVHDYMSGMMSVRMNGASLPEVDGSQLGAGVKHVLRIVSVFLLLMVTAVFVSGPADLLHGMVPGLGKEWWVAIIFVYYMLATLLPIDKVIGRIYPVFGFLLIFMALGIMGVMLWTWAPVAEVTEGLASRHPQGYPIFPMMFVSIACGAVSGFHATQTPMMARCVVNEKYCRPCFYGAMIAEGIVALIWAAAASSFWGSTDGLNEFVASAPKGANPAAQAVSVICNTWLGRVGGILAVLGVVVAPITTGDTALRSARLTLVDIIGFDQQKIWKRLAVAVPLFVITYVLLQIDFQILWRYFAWSNQTLAAVTLWAVTVYLAKNRRFYWLTLIPAMFMTSVSVAYLLYAPECKIMLPYELSCCVSFGAVAVLTVIFFVFMPKWRKVEK